jgi:DNA invertase Pin-like site-specific DNA recombinase
MGQGWRTQTPKKKVEDKVIKELFDLGKTAPEIAKLLDYTSAGIRYRLKQMGYTFKTNYRPDLDNEAIKQMYEAGLTAREIAFLFDTTHTAIAGRLKKMGIRIKTHKESWKNQFGRSDRTRYNDVA